MSKAACHRGTLDGLPERTWGGRRGRGDAGNKHSTLCTAHAWLEKGAPFGGVENRNQGQAEGGHQGLVSSPQHTASALTKPERDPEEGHSQAVQEPEGGERAEAGEGGGLAEKYSPVTSNIHFKTCEQERRAHTLRKQCRGCPGGGGGAWARDPRLEGAKATCVLNSVPTQAVSSTCAARR